MVSVVEWRQEASRHERAKSRPDATSARACPLQILPLALALALPCAVTFFCLPRVIFQR